MARKKKLSERQVKKTLENIIRRYGKARITMQDAGFEPPCSCMCKSCKSKYLDYEAPDMRRRVIDSKGNCKVAYKSGGYKTWSGYSECCFMDDYNDSYDDDGYRIYNTEFSVKKTLKFMFDHDKYELEPILIEYGKRFSKKRKLV